jgi:hypothetical protein
MVVCPVNAIAVQIEPVENLASRYKRLRPTQPAQDTWIWQRLG